VSPLVKAGYQVVAFDAPGHGRSAKHQTTLFEVSDVLHHVVAQVGPPQAVIAHSFGTMVTTLAIQQGLVLDKAVCISAPTSLGYLAVKFSNALHIGKRTQQRLFAKFEQDFGADIWQRASSDVHVAHCETPALIIHDKQDVDVDSQQSERLAQAWPGALLWQTEGLGHRRILRNPDVVSGVAEYIVHGAVPVSAKPMAVRSERLQSK
jgi:pimeloyl-ACP methyl ester carboxylesterase